MRVRVIIDYCKENWRGETMWRVVNSMVVVVLVGKQVAR